MAVPTAAETDALSPPQAPPCVARATTGGGRPSGLGRAELARRAEQSLLTQKGDDVLQLTGGLQGMWCK